MLLAALALGPGLARAGQATVSDTTLGETVFVVPAGVASLHATVVGAPGGTVYASPGGAGAAVTGDIAV